jgi:hypothetical protein
VPSLVWKLKRARELVLGSEDAYMKLTDSALPADITEWKRGERRAQASRVKDICSMDYFALKTIQGLSISLLDISELNILSFLAPRKAEVQLELVNTGLHTGHLGPIDFVAKGLSIQESQ